MEVVSNKIANKSLFNLLCAELTTRMSIFCILCGFAALFGAQTADWNSIYHIGMEGLLYGTIMGPCMGLIFTHFIWLFLVVGLWVCSFFEPNKMYFKQVSEESAKVV